jgi:hypothetical protein
MTKALKRIMRNYPEQSDIFDLDCIYSDFRKIARRAIKEMKRMKDE